LKNIKTDIYEPIILPVVLNGCEIWFPTLQEEHRLRVFENRVLRIIFGLKRDEVTEVRFEVFMAVTMKNGVFWDVMPHGVTSQKTPFFK
jgi:hypothetical protein